METNDQWIRERTGITERRIGEEHETPSFMAIQCAHQLLREESLQAEEIDLILVATVTPDYVFPPTAGIIQNAIGATRAWGFDLEAACSGYLYGLETARAFIESGLYRNVLLVAAEKMSSILDYSDRSTCILFGDAGSVTWLRASHEGGRIIDSQLRLDGSGVGSLYMPAGGAKRPPSHETIDNHEHCIRQDGRAVYKRAVADMAEISLEVLKRNHLKASDLALFVPHQANLRILESVAKRLELPMEAVAVNLDRYGNTTSATIPTALQEAKEQARVKEGDYILMAAFGAGFTWGATLIQL